MLPEGWGAHQEVWKQVTGRASLLGIVHYGTSAFDPVTRTRGLLVAFFLLDKREVWGHSGSPTVREQT